MRYGILIALAVTAGSSVAFGWFAHAKNSPRHAPAELVINDVPLNREGNFVTSFAPVVKRVAPSVVKVYTTAKFENTAVPHFRSPGDSMLRRFFDGPFGGMPLPDRMPMPRREGVGSGVIVTENGYLLTNNHVIEGADEVRVVMSPDNEEYKAEVIGRDPKSDIAVLKIDGTDLPFIEVADSDQIEVGDVVLAIGNPFGVGQTVTMGMVSATGRGGHLGLDYEDFIQTDAAINPGNSGGALIDAEGRLIGINTAILSRTGGNHGIGFAIPVNLARNIMESLLENGHVVRGFLGVFIQDVNQALADYFGLEDAVGAVVSDVAPESPAAEGGLREGDVIVKFNGKKVRSSRGLKVMVGQTAPGEEIEIEILRDGDTEHLWVTLDELSSDQQVATIPSHGDRQSDSLDGVTVTDIDSRSQQELNLPPDLKGALVRDIDPASASWKAGLRPGDVIRGINRNSVESAKEAVALSETLDDDKVLLRVWRNGGSLYIVVDERQLK